MVRTEILMRIVVGIVSGIILSLWTILIKIITIIHFIIALIQDKRNKDLAKFCNIWIAQWYAFVRYMTFTTNKRLFPFNKLNKIIEKVEMK